MKLNPFSLIEQLINEHGSSAMLKERLLLLKDVIGKLENEARELKEALHTCADERAQLQKELREKTVAEEFVEYRGVFFKRKASGGYHEAVYCPSCKLPMSSSMENFVQYTCTKCGFFADFCGRDLPRILELVNKEYS
jgi:hypothetical protein